MGKGKGEGEREKEAGLLIHAMRCRISQSRERSGRKFSGENNF